MAKKKRRPSGRRPEPSTAAAGRRPARLSPDVPVLVGAGLGLLLTAYLAWHAGAAPAFCDENSGCAAIQSSAWSSFLGLPLATWGFGLYALIALAAATGRSAVARWRWLSRFTGLGLALSLFLTVAGWVDVRATCIWCLASLALFAGLFARVHLRRPAGAPGVSTRWSHWWLGNGLAALVVAVLLTVSGTNLIDRRPADPRVAGLVTHLDSIGAKYYGASWCANCRRQTRMFGASAGQLPYVECAPEGRGGAVASECRRAGVSAYPTWVIHGLEHQGLKTPEELAQLSGYIWERSRSAE